MSVFEGNLRADADACFAIIVSRWNAQITEALVEGARKALLDNGVDEEKIDIIRVPGAWEIPQVARQLSLGSRHDAIITLGCVVRGDTRHYEHVADNCAKALMELALASNLPISNGVLAVETVEDARARAGGVYGNKGEEAAIAAIEMLDLFDQLVDAEAQSDGFSLGFEDDPEGVFDVEKFIASSQELKP